MYFQCITENMTIQNKLTVQIREMKFQGSDYKTKEGDKINLEEVRGKLEARTEEILQNEAQNDKTIRHMKEMRQRKLNEKL